MSAKRSKGAELRGAESRGAEGTGVQMDVEKEGSRGVQRVHSLVVQRVQQSRGVEV